MEHWNIENALIIGLYLSIFLITYNYFIYPLSIIFLAKNHATKKNHPTETPLPSVSFIIAAYNEEDVIENKIKNTLSLNYPKDLLQVIICSDGSTDKTPEIVLSYHDSGIYGMHDNARRGKSAALNRAVRQSNSDIIIFSDANNDFSVDSIKSLVKHFADAHVGAVTGAKHIYKSNDRQSSVGDGLYWKYESAIKSAESVLGSITAAEGEIFAVRRSLFKPIEENLINDDAAITFSVVKAQYRVLYDKNAKSFEEASRDLVDDLNVKIRMTAGGFQTIVKEWKTLFPPTSWFAFNFISHKVLRWLTPHFMIMVFVSSLLLLHRLDAQLLLTAQILFYSASAYGWIYRSDENLKKVFYIPMYFTAMNIALFIGFCRFINGRQNVNWKRAER